MASDQPRETSIFLAASQIESADERAAFLMDACGADSTLRNRVEARLAAFVQESESGELPSPQFSETIAPEPSSRNRDTSLDAGLVFPIDVETAIVIGDAGQSVLRSLGNTLDLPHVALHESEASGDVQSSSPSSPQIPHHDSDNRYRIDGEIARGGMGAVLRGRDMDLGRDLAIKVLLDSHSDRPEAIQRFVEEAQIGGQLQHPGIAPVYELGQFADERLFFSMKLVKGKTLAKLLSDRKHAAEERGKFIGIFEQICQTMAYAHSRHVIHRDLKPDNIMVGAFGEVQVMDWGLAKVLQPDGVADGTTPKPRQQNQSVIQTRVRAGSDAAGSFETAGSQTQMGCVMGTPAYMPPEQALGEIDQLDQRADVFGLGAILCQILTGDPPYMGDNGTQIFRMASRGKLGDAFKRVEACGADEDLITLTKCCLEAEPKDRPQDAGVLAERVTGYIESVEAKLREAEVQRASEAARADAEEERAAAESARANEESKRRKTSLALATSVLMLVALGSGGWLYMERQEANRQTEEAIAQRSHAAEMEILAEQRDDQRKVAETARASAEFSQQQANTEKINSLNMLADMQTERGLLAARNGQSATAALWFANAAKLTPHDPDRQRANHLRTTSWIKNAMVPAALLEVPEGDVQRFEFQPNGPLLQAVTGSALRVWSWRNEVALPWSEALVNVADAAWSPDGQRLAVGFGTSDVRIFHSISGDELMQFRHSEPVEVIEWSADGKRLAVGGVNVQVWKVADQPVLESQWLHPQSVYGMRFNRAGTRLVTSCADSFARVFALGNASSVEPLFAPIEHAPFERNLSVSAVFFADDRRLMTVSESTQQPVLRDAATGQPVTPGWSDFGMSARRGFAVSPDSNWAAASGAQSAFLLGSDGQKIELVHNNHVRSICFGHNGQSLLTTCWDGTARLWPLKGMEGTTPTVGSPIEFPQKATMTNGVFSPDGLSLAIMTSNAEQPLLVWESTSRQLVAGEIAWSGRDWRARPSFNGQFVTPGAMPANPSSESPGGKTLRVARIEDGQPAGPPITLNGLVWDSCLCADNRTVAVGTMDGKTGRLELHDITSGQPVVAPISLPDLPFSVSAHPKRDQVAVLCRNGKLIVFDSKNGQTLLHLSHDGWPSGLGSDNSPMIAYTPDGTSLLTVISTGNSPLFVRDSQSGELRFAPLKPVLEGGPCRTIAISSDSHLLATAVNGKNMVQVWDLTTGKKVGRGMPHSGDSYGLFSVAFSPDGNQILTGHKDGRARLWDWRTGKLTGPPMIHFDEVYDAQFTPDGQYIVTAVRYSTPWVWDLATRKPAVPVPSTLHERSSQSLTIVGDRVVVSAEYQFPVIDLSFLLQKTTDDLSTLLTRAELMTNQKLQLGEMVPLEGDEWTDRWERWVATRPTPDEAAQSLANKFGEAETDSARRDIAVQAIRLNLAKRLQRLLPNDPGLLISLARGFSDTGRKVDLKWALSNVKTDQLKTKDTALSKEFAELLGAGEYWQRAIPIYDQLLSETPTDLDLLSKRAAAHIATGQSALAKADWTRILDQQPDQLEQAIQSFVNREYWSEAAEFGRQLAKQNPTDSILWIRVATLTAMSGDDTAYTEFSQWIAKQPMMGNTGRAENAIKACSIIASQIDRLTLPLETLAKGLETGDHTDWLPPYGWGTLALQDYRSGDFDAAIKHVAKSQEYNPSPLFQTVNWSIVALAQHKLQHPDEAKAALDEAAKRFGDFQEDTIAKSNHDRLITELLFREAQAVLKTKDVSLNSDNE